MNYCNSPSSDAKRLTTTLALFLPAKRSNRVSASQPIVNSEMITAVYLILIVSFVSQAAVIITSSSDVRVETINGNTTIYLDGRQVDLSNAKVIQETDSVKMLEPSENDKYVITVDKRTDRVLSVSTKDGARVIQTNLTPEQEEKFIKQFQESFSNAMDDFRRSMKEMSHRLGSLWN